MDGIIIINKEKGCTSHDIVYKAKKIFNKKVGHTGTLDPNATGVLPLLVGKGTEISKYLINLCALTHSVFSSLFLNLYGSFILPSALSFQN